MIYILKLYRKHLLVNLKVQERVTRTVWALCQRQTEGGSGLDVHVLSNANRFVKHSRYPCDCITET